MANQIKEFEEMKVWQDSLTLAKDIYCEFANCKDFSFIDQIKRVSVSISNNIAEGSERSTNAEFARFLDIAKGSCGEVRSMIQLAFSLGYIDSLKVTKLKNDCLQISKQLAGFAKFLRESV